MPLAMLIRFSKDEINCLSIRVARLMTTSKTYEQYHFSLVSNINLKISENDKSLLADPFFKFEVDL